MSVFGSLEKDARLLMAVERFAFAAAWAAEAIGVAALTWAERAATEPTFRRHIYDTINDRRAPSDTRKGDR